MSFLLGFCSYSFASVWGLDDIDIISRAEWGADETKRLATHEVYQKINKSNADYAQYLIDLKKTNYGKYLQTLEASKKSSTINNYLSDNFLSEFLLDKTKTTYDWQKLWRREQISNIKNKIIVHHTATSRVVTTKEEAIDLLKRVYNYHALENGWGDIGYNFLIDPLGNIYEWRAGGAGVVGAHAKYNNTSSIGISLMWNFEETSPSPKALAALEKLVYSLSKKYWINPKDKVAYHIASEVPPYVKTVYDYSIVWHKDSWITACPGKNLYSKLPTIINNVSVKLWYKKFLSEKSSIFSYQRLEEINIILKSYLVGLKNKIWWSIATKFINKNVGSIDIWEVKNYLEKDISVLLYDLTQNYSKYDISCYETCNILLDENLYKSQSLQVITYKDDLKISVWDETYRWKTLSIFWTNDVVVDNYDRKSYVGIPWNVFEGILLFKKEDIKDLNWEISEKYVVINKLPFQSYLEGIVETNDTESLEKNKIMSLVAKTYALFYLQPDNIHPSIPLWVSYNAVDDPRIFQKYVGVWLKKTLTKWYQALESTKDKVVVYDNKIVILPYFNCSALFTYSAQEKWWWNDAPYLVSKLDLWICDDKNFNGHGVWMSGKWAQLLSLLGLSYDEIIQYYYPGVMIKNI